MKGKYDAVIDRYIPENVSLTDAQQSYLKALVELQKKQPTVGTADIVRHTGKPASAVSSVMKALSSKGITEIDEQGNISLKNKEAQEARPAEIASEQGTEQTEKETTKKTPIPEGLSAECRKLGFTRTGSYITGYMRDKKDPNVEEITIPEGATGVRGFSKLEKLKVVHLPSTITEIGVYAFTGCTSLKRVDFPSGAPNLKKIELCAFSGCSVLCFFQLPDSLVSIGQSAFNECTQYNPRKLPSGLMEIRNRAFQGCKALQRVTVPSKVKVIGENAFSECSSLSEVTIENGVEEIGDWAFYEDVSITQIDLPDSIRKIGSYCFSECRKLKEITFPPQMETIGDWAFGLCSALVKANLPSGLTKLGNSLFNSCHELKTVSIPEGIKEVESQVFRSCENLKEVTFPESIETIREKAFMDDDGISCIRIPDKDFVFEKEIGFPEKAIVRYPMGQKPSGTEQRTIRKTPQRENQRSTVKKAASVPSVKKSSSGNESRYNSRISFVLPAGFKMNWVEQNDGTKACEIVTDRYIDDEGKEAYHFTARVSEDEIQIPEDVNAGKVSLLEKMHLADPERKYARISDDPPAEYQVKATPIAFLNSQIQLYAKVLCVETSDKKALIVFHTALWNEEKPEDHVSQFETLEQLAKAVRIDGKPLNMKTTAIRSIASELVPDYEGAESIGKIGLNIQVNDKLAYTDVESERKELDELEEKCSQLHCSFWGGYINDCEDKFIEEIDIPRGVTGISSSAFFGCSMLRRVSIPETVKKIEMSAFEDCTALEEIEIPDSVKELQGSAFKDCTSLRSAKLPAGITTIEFSLFNGCSKLTDIEIPEGVTEIGDQAFNACSSLREIVLPDSIESIGKWAFDECDRLEVIYMPDKEVTTDLWAIPEKVTVIKRPLGRSAASGKSKTGGKPASRTAALKGRFTVVTPGDEYYSHYGKLKREHEKFTGMGVRHVSNNGKEHEAIPLSALMERQDKTNNPVYRRLKQIEARDNYELKNTALLLAQVFRVERSKFDARHDDEGDIGVTMLEKKWQFSALRSFAWTLADLADREGKSIDDYDTDDLLEICRFIEQRKWLNYEGESWFNGLCGHDDIHVCYMPQAMINDGSAEGIHDVFQYMPIVSLDDFRADLAQLKNSMIKIHNRLLEHRDRSVRLESPEASVLKAWCALVMSAETSFYSEDGPMVFFHGYPETPLNSRPVPLAAKAAKQKKAAPKAKKEDPADSVSGAEEHVLMVGTDGIRRVRMGEYPAGEPIVWRILDDSDGETYLMISEYALDTKPFCDGFEKTTNEWAGSTLRTWLNDEFLNNAFTSAERNEIITVTYTNQKKTKNGFEQVESTSEKVSLLDSVEVRNYFPNERDRLCKATAYAKSHGAEISGGPDLCNWWLRSPAMEAMGLPMWSPRVQTNGSMNGWGYNAGGICVRPVIRVKQDFIVTELVHSASKEAQEKVRQAKKTGRYTMDMLPEGLDDPQSILDELNEMDPEQAEGALTALIGVQKLNKELSGLTAMLGGVIQDSESAQQEEERRRKEEEAQKQRQRESLESEISALERERDSLKGLFAGFKRARIQRQIDELRERLRRL